MKTVYFPEAEESKLQARTSQNTLTIQFEDGGSAEIRPTTQANLYGIHFKGLKQPDSLKGQNFTSIDRAERALRTYLDKQGIKPLPVQRALAHEDRNRSLLRSN